MSVGHSSVIILPSQTDLHLRLQYRIHITTCYLCWRAQRIHGILACRAGISLSRARCRYRIDIIHFGKHQAIDETSVDVHIKTANEKRTFPACTEASISNREIELRHPLHLGFSSRLSSIQSHCESPELTVFVVLREANNFPVVTIRASGILTFY